MKSGDVLHLTMTVEFEEQQALRITPEDAPLETAQELQALLDRLRRSTTRTRPSRWSCRT